MDKPSAACGYQGFGSGDDPSGPGCVMPKGHEGPCSARSAATELPAGSVVVERYVYVNPNGRTGVQWLSQVVGRDGSLRLYKACRTRHEALAEADRRG